MGLCSGVSSGLEKLMGEPVSLGRLREADFTLCVDSQGCRDFLTTAESTSLGRLFGSTVLSHSHTEDGEEEEEEEAAGCAGTSCGVWSCVLQQDGAGTVREGFSHCPE